MSVYCFYDWSVWGDIFSVWMEGICFRLNWKRDLGEVGWKLRDLGNSVWNICWIWLFFLRGLGWCWRFFFCVKGCWICSFLRDVLKVDNIFLNWVRVGILVVFFLGFVVINKRLVMFVFVLFLCIVVFNICDIRMVKGYVFRRGVRFVLYVILCLVYKREKFVVK